MTITPGMIKAAVEGLSVDATPAGILRSERAGQQQLVASTNMPKDMHPSREAFEKVGFTFGDDVDDIFVKSTLPPGWTRAATDHSMHSDVLDEKGRKRVGVFYKAAFYDRRASSFLNCRFRIDTLSSPYDKGIPDGEYAYAVRDAGAEIYRTTSFKMRDRDADRKAKAEARDWLAERYPNADDPTLNW